MNTYLSSTEKELFTRLDVLLGESKLAIDTYSKNNADKEFMRCLKTGYTWLNKALARRMLLLADDSRDDLKRNVSHMQIILSPNDKAQREFKKIKEMNSTLPISVDDFNDWYCSVIPFTCGNCKDRDYKNCLQRKFLMKFGVYPVNTHAVDTCQYNYLDTGINLDDIAKKRKEREKSCKQ